MRLAAVALLILALPLPASAGLPYERMATRIVDSLAPEAGERAIVRFDPELMPDLAVAVEEGLAAKGVEVERLAYGPHEGFREKLDRTQIYIWLPDGSGASGAPLERIALHDWLVKGKGRQVHFHWGDGTRALDGKRGEHSAAYDEVYLRALAIDHSALYDKQAAAVAALASDEIRVTTPAGTDLRFRTGDRPFTLQDGDASKATTDRAGAIIGREIELPAGVLRVAPIEESVEGTLVIREARFGATVVKELRLQFQRGRISGWSAVSGETAFAAALEAAPALAWFRELGIGFNPALVVPEGEPWIPYYGYGAGVVRLSLGNNQEVGGAVDGAGARWLFSDDATVAVGETLLVEDGRLVHRP